MDLNYKSEEMEKNIEPFFYHYRYSRKGFFTK